MNPYKLFITYDGAKDSAIETVHELHLASVKETYRHNFESKSKWTLFYNFVLKQADAESTTVNESLTIQQGYLGYEYHATVIEMIHKETKDNVWAIGYLTNNSMIAVNNVYLAIINLEQEYGENYECLKRVMTAHNHPNNTLPTEDDYNNKAEGEEHFIVQPWGAYYAY